VQDIFLHDRDTDTDGLFDEAGAVATMRVSVDSLGTEADAASAAPAISADGTYVGFVSSATNLAASDTNAVDDVLVHDPP
ncbi:MAG: hypothetical protein AAB426_00225, partial [Myxococcota bacterium]